MTHSKPNNHAGLRMAVAAIVCIATFASSATLAARIGGNRYDNTLIGTDSNDRIFGRGGNDSVYGKGGNDRLRGGRGNDYVNGGSGYDLCWGGYGYDSFTGCERVRDPDQPHLNRG